MAGQMKLYRFLPLEMEPEISPVQSRRVPLELIAALAMIPLMITGESLWVDEIGSTYYAAQQTFSRLLDALGRERGSRPGIA